MEWQASLPQRNQDKWISDFQAYAVEEIDWNKTYSLLFLYTPESKLRVFQVKLIHRWISTNRYLFKVGLSSSELWVLLLWKHTGIPFTSLLRMSKNQSILERRYKMVRYLFLSLDKKFRIAVIFGFCGWHYSPSPLPRPPNYQVSPFLG